MSGGWSLRTAPLQAFWADLPAGRGSESGFRRPVVVVQGDASNRSRISTVVCVPLTSNLRWAQAPGTTLLPTGSTGLAKSSVANASQVVTIDRAFLTEPVGSLPPRQLQLVLAGIDLVPGRSA